MGRSSVYALGRESEFTAEHVEEFMYERVFFVRDDDTAWSAWIIDVDTLHGDSEFCYIVFDREPTKSVRCHVSRLVGWDYGITLGLSEKGRAGLPNDYETRYWSTL
jgi:hypothetical protein